MNEEKVSKDLRYRRVQGILGNTSFSLVLPKSYALDLGIGKGDYVKVKQEGNRIWIEKEEDT